MGEDGQGDWWEEDGGAALAEVQRDGPVQLPAPAAAGVRHLQELRGPLPRGLHGRQRCGDAWEGDLLRAEGGSRRRWQEEVIRLGSLVPTACAFLIRLRGLYRGPW